MQLGHIATSTASGPVVFPLLACKQHNMQLDCNAENHYGKRMLGCHSWYNNIYMHTLIVFI